MFENIREANEPTERVLWTVPIQGAPKLLVSHAGRSNKKYRAALAQQAVKRQVGAQKQTADGLLDAADEMLETVRSLFPKCVVHGWEGMERVVPSGVAPEFTPETCEEFLRALPDWIVQQLDSFCGDPLRFTPDGEPTDAEVAELAGN